MQTTLKHIQVGSAFRVGVILYGLIFAVFGLLFVGLQSLFVNAITNLARTSGGFDSSTSSNFLGVGVLSLLCLYGVGVVAAAIFGGIQLAIIAFLYNLTANWVGGLRVELETDDSGLLNDIERDMGSRKRDDLQEPPTL